MVMLAALRDNMCLVGRGPEAVIPTATCSIHIHRSIHLTTLFRQRPKTTVLMTQCCETKAKCIEPSSFKFGVVLQKLDKCILKEGILCDSNF